MPAERNENKSRIIPAVLVAWHAELIIFFDSFLTILISLLGIEAKRDSCLPSDRVPLGTNTPIEIIAVKK